MSKKKPAAVAPVAKRSSPRARAVAARATSAAAVQAKPVPATVVAPVVEAAAEATQSEQVDEAQVQAAFGAHAHHSSVADSVTDHLSITTNSTATVADPASSDSADVVLNEVASLQSMAQQQDEYQRKLMQLQQQHEQQQQQWQMRQQTTLQQQQQKVQEQAERQDRMQQIQQKLHERIQLKQLHGSGSGGGSPSPVANTAGAAAGQTLATQQLRQAIIQREEREMTQSLADHQMQLYKAMVHDLEMQSGVPMTPLPSPAISDHGPGFEAELIPAPILPGTTTLDATTAKAYEDFQRARQEQQLRLQQYQQIQHASAAGGGSANSPSIRTQVVSSDGDLVRQQMMAEQERLRVLQAREMQQQQQQQSAAHSREQLVSSQEQLLIQQHDILRQQQILQGLLQRQQHAAARQAQPQQQQKASTTKKTAASSSSGEGVLPPPPAKKRKKAATSPESQMEALVCELIRLSNASTAIEVRTSLDKMTAWVHRSFDAELLKFAQRDFRDVVLAKRPSLVQANQWTSDIQVKCEYIIEKIAQVIMAVSIQRPAKAAEATSATGAAASSIDQANAIRLAAKEHAYAALKAQLMQQQKGKGSSGSAAVKLGAQTANSSSGTKKQSLFVDLSLLNPKQKANTQSQNQAAASTTGTGATGSTADAKPTSTTTPSAPPASTKAVKAVPPVALKSASASTSSATTAPLSPRLVQQLYEVDLKMRSCTGNDEEGDDKFYIPVKSIAKVMRRALPDDRTNSSQTTTKGGKRSSGPVETAAVKIEETSALTHGAEETKETEQTEGDEEMKTGEAGDAEEEESKPSSSATPVASISLAALALQKRQEMVERNLQQSGQVPIKIDDDAVAFMQECVTEFILYLTSEAKDHWAIDKKKTNSLLGGHVVQGMDNLGFATYARVLDTFNTKIKKVQDAQAQKRVEKKLLDKKLKQQQKLREVAEAKARAAAVAATTATAAGSSGSTTTTATTTVVTSRAAASEAAAVNIAAAVSSSLHEQALMAREDLSAHQ